MHRVLGLTDDMHGNATWPARRCSNIELAARTRSAGDNFSADVAVLVGACHQNWWLPDSHSHKDVSWSNRAGILANSEPLIRWTFPVAMPATSFASFLRRP